MSYHIKRKESLIDGVRRIAHSQLDKMIGEVEDKRLDRHETIHQVRKRCKKIRGLLRLVRPGFEGTYQRENKSFRDAARQLSDIRDAAALIETYDMLLDRFDDQVERREFGPIRAALTRELHQLSEHEEEIDNKLAQFTENMEEAKRRVEGWALDGDEFAPAAAGIKKTYKRGQQAMSIAYGEPTPENFHEWRKRVKYYRYQLRILRELWPQVLNPTRKELHRLSDLLGDDHDLHLFQQKLRSGDCGDSDEVSVLLGLADERRTELEAEAAPLGRRIYAEKPKRLVQRLERYWEAWKASDAAELAAS